MKEGSKTYLTNELVYLIPKLGSVSQTSDSVF